MLTLIIIGAIVLFLAFILSLNGKLTVAYSDEFSLTLRILFVKIKLLPKNDKPKRVRPMSKKAAERLERKLAKKEAKQEEKKLQKKQQHQGEEKEGGNRSLSEILSAIELTGKIIKAALGTFWGHLKIDVVRFKIKVATDNAATTAVAYGTVSQAVAYLFEFLNHQKKIKRIKTSGTDISCDFLSDTPEADIKLILSLRGWHILHIGLLALISLVKHKIDLNNKNNSKTNNKYKFTQQ